MPCDPGHAVVAVGEDAFQRPSRRQQRPGRVRRAGWQATVADASARGIGGLLVPADDRLIDLLRYPGDTGDRRDLHLAQG